MKSIQNVIRFIAIDICVAATWFVATSMSEAQIIYSNNFNTDDSSNWAVNASYTNATFNPATLVYFNFDYTTVGLPIAPHSAEFGSAAIHHGLKISACYTNPATLLGSAVTTGISASPTNFSITANFVMHADMWMNVDCTAYATYQPTNVTGASYADNNHDSTASTVLYGCGYGTKGTVATTPGVTDAIWVGALTDNGSSAQYRMYGPETSPVDAQASYQDGVFQTSGTVTPAFPGDPYVYNLINGLTGSGNGPGCRNMIATTGNPPYTSAQLSTNLATGVAWGTIFPPTKVPDAQTNLYPQQMNNCSLPGFLDFAWHDVEVDKIGSVIIYKIDGNIIATGNYASAGTPAGSFLTFVATRTATSVASAASGANYTNLNFVVFANIVVSNYDNVVNVSASTPTCQEGVPASPGVFTITRSSAGVPLTVSYTLTGTATNGVNYQTLPITVTFASTATSTNIYVVPIDDGIPNVTSTVVLTLQNGTGYAGAGSAVVSILDGDTPTVDISSPSGAQAYGRYTGTSPGSGNNDYIPFTLTRRGKLTTGSSLTVNIAYAGSAIGGTDFTPVSSVSIADGAQTAPLAIAPLDNSSVTTNRTVIASVSSVTGGAVGNGPATGTIVSAHYAAPVAVLLSDDLQSSVDSNNWSITYGTGDPTNDSVNYSANFGFSLSSDPSGNSIPAPPGGNSAALHLTCNKQIPSTSTPAPGAVNCYYTNVFLSGNYAVRFNMNIIEGQSAAGNSEGPIFGINHTGTCSNWWYGSGTIAAQNWSSDGVWYYINAQPLGSASGDYMEFSGAGGTNGNLGHMTLTNAFAPTFAQDFKDDNNGIYGPFTTYDANNQQGTAGTPANGSSVTSDDSTWSDVEIKQINGIITMSINHTPIFVYTNTTVWTNGYLMLGYADPFGGSVGAPEAGVYYANLQVVQLAAPIVITINSIAINGGNVVITFTTSSAADTNTSFTVLSSGTVNGAYNAVSPAASITSLGGNQFQATTPYIGGTQFYLIQHN
jgi:hypothetical protein